MEDLTPDRALRFSFELRRTEKYFAAQKVLERSLDAAQSEAVEGVESPLLAIISELASLTEEYKPEAKAYPHDYYYILGSLADLHLLQGHTPQGLIYAEAAVKASPSPTALSRSFQVNVVFHSLFVSGLRVMYSLLGQKKLGPMARTVRILERLALWLNGEDWSCVTERVFLAVGYFHLLMFSWFGDDEKLSLASQLLDQVQSLEARIVLTYYTDPESAKSTAYELVRRNPTSMTWTWLGILETDKSRAFNAFKQAVALDTKNYVAWTALAIAQAADNRFEESAKSWVVSHKFNHKNPVLWLLSSYLNRLLQQQSVATDHFKLAIHLDPTLVLVQLKEEFEALG